jgi:hypothetical protein
MDDNYSYEENELINHKVKNSSTLMISWLVKIHIH